MKTENKTRVKFYLDNGGDVFAYFPDILTDSKGNNTCYSHIGQHSACSPNYVKGKKLATPEQFAPLLAELKGQGYENLQVIDPRQTLTKIIHPVDTKRGAPMGRPNIGTPPKSGKIYDKWVSLSQGYDKGGAYWGYPNNLRVKFTKNLYYIEFYRADY